MMGALLSWDRCAQIKAELALLCCQWPIILSALAFQYVHGIFTQLAYHMHQPAVRPLHDVGFAVIPELPRDWQWASEALFTALLLAFICWTFTPLIFRRSFSTALLWTRLLTVLVVCQFLRIISFSSTQLPGPAAHCRLPTITATRPWPSTWYQHLNVDVKRQVARSCGDLIFSSHMTFILIGVLAYNHYGSKGAVKVAAWVAAVMLALLIIAARKHYTVDVVVAWYVVPLVYTVLHVYWGKLDSSNSSSSSNCKSHCDCSRGSGGSAASGHSRSSSSSSSSSAASSQIDLEIGEAVPVLQPGLKLPCCVPLMGSSSNSSVASKAGSHAAVNPPGSPATAAAQMNQHRMWWLPDHRPPTSHPCREQQAARLRSYSHKFIGA